MNAVIFAMGVVAAVTPPGVGLDDAAQKKHRRGNVFISKRCA